VAVRDRRQDLLAVDNGDWRSLRCAAATRKDREGEQQQRGVEPQINAVIPGGFSGRGYPGPIPPDGRDFIWILFGFYSLHPNCIPSLFTLQWNPERWVATPSSNHAAKLNVHPNRFPIYILRSGLHSQRCSTCLHAAFKYGTPFSSLLFYIWISDKTWVCRFGKHLSCLRILFWSLRDWPAWRRSLAASNLHPMADCNISDKPCTDAMYASGGHLCDCARYGCNCHCNDFYHHHPSSLRCFPSFRRLTQGAGYECWSSSHFLTYRT